MLNDVNQSFSSLASLGRAERSNTAEVLEWSVENTTEVSTDSFCNEKFSCLYYVRSNDCPLRGGGTLGFAVCLHIGNFKM